MGAARTFNTPVDKYVRLTGKTRKSIAKRAQVSTSSLWKVRALNPENGGINWTVVALVGVEMGIFQYGEAIDERDPRLQQLADYRLLSSRGRRAPNFDKNFDRSST